MPQARRYFSLETHDSTADLNIYGDIVPYESGWFSDPSDVTALSIAQQLEELSGIDIINVNIKSFGGDVNEGLAIYNALRRHSAKIVTRCDGFACSIASVIFMAGDERIVYDASLLMIHNAWTTVRSANAAELRKAADDMDKITQASKNAYLSRVNIDEAKLSELMDAETWISPQEALDMGFATTIEAFSSEDEETPNQSARHSLYSLVMASRAPLQAYDNAEDEPPGDADHDDPGEDDNPHNKEKAALAAFLMALENILNERNPNNADDN